MDIMRRLVNSALFGSAFLLGAACLLEGLTGGPVTVGVIQLPQVRVLQVREVLAVSGALVLALIGAVLLGTLTAAKDVDGAVFDSERNRRAMLQRVQVKWIDGLLRPSLFALERMDLPTVTRDDLIEARSHTPSYVRSVSAVLVPQERSIRQVFDDAGHALLILGGPGAGKTTLLLELASSLLVRARSDLESQMPAVFNLRSWATRRGSLDDWLTRELWRSYQIPTQVGRWWVDHERILPLLDGLNELEAGRAQACVRAINSFRAKHGFLPIAVSCQTKEYVELSERLQLFGAIEIESLTEGQVTARLRRMNIALRAALESLGKETLQSPLFLDVAVRTYAEGRTRLLLKGDGVEERRRSLLIEYADAMFTRGPPEARYSRASSMTWLKWLARGLRNHSQAEFYPDLLQADWIPGRFQRWLAIWLIPLLLGVAGGLVFGVSLGLVAGLVNAIVVEPAAGVAAGLGVGLVSALVGGAVIGLVVASFGRIRTVEPTIELHWSWTALRKKLLPRLGRGIALGIGFGVLAGLLLDLILRPALDGSSGLVNGFLVALLGSTFVGGAAGLASGVLGGLTPGQLNEVPSQPNQAIRESVRHGLFGGMIVSLVVAVVMGPFSGSVAGVIWGVQHGAAAGLQLGLYHALFGGLVLGLVAGIVAGLFAGGLAAVQHLVLRMLLMISGAAPWGYVNFLEWAAQRGVLRRVGGGYIFMHGLLLELFADGVIPTSSRTNTGA